MGLINFRYHLVRLLSIPVPFVPNKIPIIGGRTLIELFFFIAGAILAIVIGCRWREGASAGHTCEAIGAVVIIAALRKLGLYSCLFGISFERALIWHKALG